MLELKRKMQLVGVVAGTDPAQTQRRRMVLAVVLLVAALAIVLVKDRRIWFDSEEGELVADPGISQTSAVGAAASSSVAPARTASPSKNKPHQVAAALDQQVSETPAIVASDRQVLPPLDIEVVAGDNRHRVRAANKSVQVDMNPPLEAPVTPETATAPKVTMSRDAAHAVDRSVDPSYPILARQMKVQGAVVLQALIGSDGLIQDLRVLSGPGILASAAREAVRQWRFKPYLQNGKPVETQARITVNFTISTL